MPWKLNPSVIIIALKGKYAEIIAFASFRLRFATVVVIGSVSGARCVYLSAFSSVADPLLFLLLLLPYQLF